MLYFQAVFRFLVAGTDLDITIYKFRRKEEAKMKKFFKKFETLMMAVTFAEEGEFETARQLMKEEELRKTDRPTIQQRPTERKVMRVD
jgi:hypothetical protein